MPRTPRDRHEMTLVSTDAAGTQRWHCPECDRLLLMKNGPDDALEIVVLRPGAHQVPHHGSFGEVRLEGIQIEAPSGGGREGSPPGYLLH